MGTTTTPSSRMRAAPFYKNRTKRVFRLDQLRITESVDVIPFHLISSLKQRFYINLITAGQTPIIVFSNVLSVEFQMIRRLIFK